VRGDEGGEGGGGVEDKWGVTRAKWGLESEYFHPYLGVYPPRLIRPYRRLVETQRLSGSERLEGDALAAEVFRYQGRGGRQYGREVLIVQRAQCAVCAVHRRRKCAFTYQANL
jgi:hypothetical protein